MTEGFTSRLKNETATIKVIQMNMRKFYLTLFLLFSTLLVTAQDSLSGSKVVDWQFTAAPASGDQYIVSITGKIADGWKLFSLTMKDDEPNTRVTLDTNSQHAQVSTLKEVN